MDVEKQTNSEPTEDEDIQTEGVDENRARLLEKIFKNHEPLKNLVQTVAIVIAGGWIGTVWLYDNWAAQYLEPPFAKLNVKVLRSGQLEDSTRFILIEVVASNISKRKFFNYANALTVRGVQFSTGAADGFDMEELGTFINDQNTRQRPWVYERSFKRDRESVLAYSQFMSQGYELQPSETFSSVMTIAIAEEIEVIDISARLTYGASTSLLDPHQTISGGLAIDKNDNLAACATRLQQKRLYQTPCDRDWNDEFNIRSAYAETSYILTATKEEDQ